VFLTSVMNLQIRQLIIETVSRAVMYVYGVYLLRHMTALELLKRRAERIVCDCLLGTD
jgi:hypothetical protein